MKRNDGDFTPIATEYKGVVYRSKCEAMFARYLELEGKHFWYEPHALDIDGWVPDFFAWSYTPPEDYEDRYFPMFDWEVIEYKPSKPTKQYVKQFTERSRKIWPIIWEQFGNYAETSGLMSIHYGSVFTKESGVIIVRSEWCGKLADEAIVRFTDHDWVSEHREAILATRFDLEVNI